MLTCEYLRQTNNTFNQIKYLLIVYDKRIYTYTKNKTRIKQEKLAIQLLSYKIIKSNNVFEEAPICKLENICG